MAYFLAAPALAQTANPLSTLTVVKQPWLDITAYGAQCDGVTDDTAAINTAINAASAMGGGSVLIPWTGTPCMADGIYLKSNVALRGTHRRLVSLWHRANGTHDLIALASPNEVRWGIYDLGINGNRYNQSGSHDELHLDLARTSQETHRSTIMNLDVLYSSGTGIYISQGNYGGGGSIDLISVNSNGNQGDGIFLSVDDTFCVRCEASQNGRNGFTIYRAGGLHLTDTKSWLNQNDGYTLDGASGGLYTGIESQANSGSGFDAVACQDLTVFGHFEGDAVGIEVRNVITSRFIGMVDQATSYGLQFAATDRGETIQNTFDLNTRSNTADVGGTPDVRNRLILNGTFASGITTGASGLTVAGAAGLNRTVTTNGCVFTFTGGVLTGLSGC